MFLQKKYNILNMQIQFPREILYIIRYAAAGGCVITAGDSLYVNIKTTANRFFCRLRYVSFFRYNTIFTLLPSADLTSTSFRPRCSFRHFRSVFCIFLMLFTGSGGRFSDCLSCLARIYAAGRLHTAARTSTEGNKM